MKNMSLERMSSGFLIVLVVTYCFFWENKFINSSLVFLGIGVVAFMALLFKRRVIFDASTKLLLSIVVVTFLSFIYTEAPFDEALKWCEAVLIIFLLACAIKNCYQMPAFLINIVMLIGLVFVFGVIAQSLGSALVKTINISMLKPDSLTMNTTMSTWGYFCGFSGYNMVSASYSMLTLFVFLGQYFSTNRKGTKILALSLVFFCLLSIILAQKRGIFIATFIAIIFVFWIEVLHKQSLNKQIAFFVSLSVIVLIIYAFLQNSESGALFLSRFNNSDDFSTGRVDIYSSLLKNWHEYFFVGNGAAATKTVYSINAHNIYIQIFYETGIIGLILYIFWFSSNLKYTYTVYKNILYIDGNRLEIIVSLAFQVGFLVYGLFGNPLNDLFLFILYTLFSAIPYYENKNLNT